MQQIMIIQKLLLNWLKIQSKPIKILIYDWRWYPTEQGASIQKFNTNYF